MNASAPAISCRISDCSFPQKEHERFEVWGSLSVTLMPSSFKAAFSASMSTGSSLGFPSHNSIELVEGDKAPPASDLERFLDDLAQPHPDLLLLRMGLLPPKRWVPNGEGSGVFPAEPLIEDISRPVSRVL